MLAAAKHRRLDLEGAAIERGSEHAHGDVGGVERVMPERRHRVFCRGRPVHEGNRAERRRADRRARQRQRDGLRQRLAPHGGCLHEEIVRVLVIDERVPLERLADLHDVAVTLLADRRGIETEHQVQRQRAAPDRSASHSHPPVGRGHLALAARAALVVEHHEDDRVLHERPSRHRHVVLHPRVRILRKCRDADRHAHDEGPRPRSHVTMMSCTT